MGQHWEILIPILLIALLVFGTKRLPEMGSAIGKTIKEFQKSMRDVREPEQPTAAVPPATPAVQPQLAQPTVQAAAQPAMTQPSAPAIQAAPATPAPTVEASAETKTPEATAS